MEYTRIIIIYTWRCCYHEREEETYVWNVLLDSHAYIYLIHCMYICPLRRPRSTLIHSRTHARMHSPKPTKTEIKNARLVAREGRENWSDNNAQAHLRTINRSNSVPFCARDVPLFPLFESSIISFMIYTICISWFLCVCLVLERTDNLQWTFAKD